MQTFSEFEEAQAALTPGFVVSGAYRTVLDADGEEREGVFGPAVYFLAPEDADAVTMGLLAYEARTGAPHPDPQYVDWLATEATL